LVLYDSLGHSDTISLIGYGTDDGIDYTYQVFNATSSDSGRHENIIVNRDSGNAASLPGQIRNHRDVGIDVLIILSDSSHWDVDGNGGSETFSLNATSDRTGGRTFQIYYTPHGVYRDSVMVTMSCSSPHSQTTTFWIYITDPLYAPHYYAPIILGPNLGANIGDNVCGTVTIFNPDSNAQPITLTAITPATNSYWSWSGLPSLPLTLQPGDSTTFTMCFATGNSYNGQYHSDLITVSYSDTSGLTGSAEGTAYGAVYGSCLESLRSNSDSLKLDEVIYGGYIEATESFIIHSDSELMAGSGIMYQGGTAQVISPSLPMRVHAGDTVAITFRVTPGSTDSSIYGLGLYYGYIPLYLAGCSGFISFQGYVIDSTSGALQLFSDQTELLALRSSTTTVTKTFDFVNSTGLTERVTSVSLANGSHFSITGYDPHAPVDTLYSNDQLGISMQFDANTTGFYQDSLTIVTEAGLSTPVIHRFNVEAIREASSGVTLITMTSPVDITLSPNPTQGLVSINIGNAPRAQVEVFDLLGSEIANVPSVSAGSYTWNAGNLPNGIYIVRASGTDENGSAFVISKRLVLER
jgi:hypothetical protein